MTRLTLACLGLLALPGFAPAQDPWIEARAEELGGFYRHLHGRPELSLREVETARLIADELKTAGFEVATGIGGTGLVGLLKNGPGPTVLVRTDLDGLPVTEVTGLPYASTVRTTDADGQAVGAMHACGHDLHMTCFVGAARWLVDHKDRWSGTAMFIGQPAEERGLGARAMRDDRLYERFGRPDFALALHVAHDLDTGKVGFCPGPAMAGATSVDLTVRGKGGHGAMPHNTVDPVVLAALLILDLQTIVSREVQPIDPAVVTVGSIQGGTKHNIIPDEVRLQLTLRAFRPEVREQLLDGIRRRAEALASSHKAPAPTVKVAESTPITVNTPELVERVVPVFREALGESNVVRVDQTMGAEDFGIFGEGGVPTFMFRLGTIPPEKVEAARIGGEPLPSLHSPRYAPDYMPSLKTGIRAMTAAVVSLMPPKRD